jgi:hypothetical protein
VEASDSEVSAALVTVEAVQQRIAFFRDQRVILDADLAAMYGVETRTLVQAVKRNLDRFPDDFMFRLNDDEFKILRSQGVMSSSWGGRRSAPYAFTEQGVAMLSSVLRSKQAAAVNIAIMRAFVQLRQMLASHSELARKVEELERRMGETDARRDEQIAQIVEAIRQLMLPPTPKKRPIGFAPPEDS